MQLSVLSACLLTVWEEKEGEGGRDEEREGGREGRKRRGRQVWREKWKDEGGREVL